MPTAINMMVPLPSAEEMHLLKELSGGQQPAENDPTLAPNGKKRTFRMVTHFGKKPPMPLSATNIGGSRTLNSRNQG